MNIHVRVFNEIMDFLFGRRYWANIVRTNGTAEADLCSFIFRSRKEADRHREQIDTTLSYTWVETICFRSRKEY